MSWPFGNRWPRIVDPLYKKVQNSKVILVVKFAAAPREGVSRRKERLNVQKLAMLTCNSDGEGRLAQPKPLAWETRPGE